MGMSASATVAFGVDLGNPKSDEWNFDLEAYDGGRIVGDPDFEHLIAEFAGFDEVELPWMCRSGSPEHAAKMDQIARMMDLRKSTSIEVGNYGYEYAGRCLYITGTRQREDWGCGPLKQLSWPRRSQVLTFNNFIDHLEGSGLKLKDEFREPKWMLMACYG
jgi:hypothetical protein